MSSSGLIYAMIVGAWAAYLVPMWLRRQDELNEARPTERFSTAIRLLTGRGSAERRAARAGDRDPDDSVPDGAAEDGGEHVPPHASADSAAMEPDGTADAPARGRDIDVRSAAVPAPPARGSNRSERRPAAPRTGKGPGAHPVAPAERRARAKVLARRRRTTTLLFVALTAGAIAAAAGGLHLLWAAAVPAVLLAAYIAHVRAQERRRFRYAADPRRAEAAAQRVRERAAAARARQAPAVEPSPADVPTQLHDPASDEPSAAPSGAGYAADRRALVEQTDHAEWVDDQERERARSRPDDSGWEPVPVPLPTYVTAPVAPRATDGLDLGAPDTWSSARSSTGDADTRPAGDPRPAAGADADEPARPEDPAADSARPRRPRERGRTPLFDQYANPDRPRAANE